MFVCVFVYVCVCICVFVYVFVCLFVFFRCARLKAAHVPFFEIVMVHTSTCVCLSVCVSTPEGINN